MISLLITQSENDPFSQQVFSHEVMLSPESIGQRILNSVTPELPTKIPKLLSPRKNSEVKYYGGVHVLFRKGFRMHQMLLKKV